jgi:hypothetical protein
MEASEIELNLKIKKIKNYEHFKKIRFRKVSKNSQCSSKKFKNDKNG